MKLELKRIAIWPIIKISFVVNLVIGFLVGIMYAFMLMLIVFAPMSYLGRDFESEMPIAVGGFMLIILPIIMAGFMAVVNTIFAVIAALIYNLAAKLFGGLEAEYRIIEKDVVAPAPPPPPEPEPPTADYPQETSNPE